MLVTMQRASFHPSQPFPRETGTDPIVPRSVRPYIVFLFFFSFQKVIMFLTQGQFALVK